MMASMGVPRLKISKILKKTKRYELIITLARPAYFSYALRTIRGKTFLPGRTS